MARVVVDNLSLNFGAVSVLKSLNIDIAEGEFLVLLGPSGCGKSTLLNCIAGLLDASSGKIFIGDRNVTWEEPKERGIGMVFQSYALYPQMSVERNLSFGLRVARVPKDEIAKRVARASEILQIEPLLQRKPAELSGGQRQRVAIGRALVRDVDVFLFDEPLSNLDAKLRSELRVEIKRLHQTLSSTMIYVTHDQVEALTLADRIAVMQGGLIQQLASPREIYHRPVNKFVAGFVGSPRMNFFNGRIESVSGQPTFVSDALTLPLQDYQFANGAADGAPAELGIRPEHIRVGVEDSGHTASVDLVEPMGAETVVWCKLAGEPLSVRMDGDANFDLHESLPVSFPGDRLNLFDPQSGERL